MPEEMKVSLKIDSSLEFLRFNFSVSQCVNFKFSRQTAREQAEKASVQGLLAEGIIDTSKAPSCSDTASTGLPSQTTSTLTSDASEKRALNSDWKQAASVSGSSSPVENVVRVQTTADKTSQLRDTAETDDSSATVMTTSTATLY